MHALRPVFTDAQLFGLFIAAADRLEALDDGGFVVEMELLEEGLHDLGGTDEEKEADRVHYVQVIVDMQDSYNKLRDYFQGHEDFGWDDDEFMPRNVDFVLLADAMR